MEDFFPFHHSMRHTFNWRSVELLGPPRKLEAEFYSSLGLAGAVALNSMRGESIVNAPANGRHTPVPGASRWSTPNAVAAVKTHGLDKHPTWVVLMVFEGNALSNLMPVFWEAAIQHGELSNYADPHWNLAGNQLIADATAAYFTTQ